jgi:predicted CxxxxCH...CXXCH cytochrome family protein
MSRIRPSASLLVALLLAVAGCSDQDATRSASLRSSQSVVPAPLGVADSLAAMACDPAFVAAHPSHNGTAIRAAVGCRACHATCAPPGQTIAFGELAQARNATPTFDPATRTCSGVYCHGSWAAVPPAPVAWAFVDPDRPRDPADACSKCHGYPPPAPHGAATSCSGCHADTVSADGSIDVAGGHHVDGRLDVTCGGCHGDPPASGAHVAHSGPDDPVLHGTYGDLSTLQDRYPGPDPEPVPTSYAYGCGHCHPLDVARHRDGVVQVELTDAAAPAGTLKARAHATAGWDAQSATCSGVYCHSSAEEPSPAFMVTPAWTSGATPACGACHGNPPAYPSGGAGAQDANSHVNLADDGYEFGHFLGMPGVWHNTGHGGRGAAPITCQTCHYGTVDPANTAPGGFYYLDTTGTYLIPGGDPGRFASGWATQLDCTSCHTGAPGRPPMGAGRVLPLRHVNGVRDVVFDPRLTLPPVAGLPVAPNTPTKPYWLARAGVYVPWPGTAVWNGTTVSFDLSAASYDRVTKRCSGVGCHLAGTPVWGRAYGWGSPEYDNCSRCHPM